MTPTTTSRDYTIPSSQTTKEFGKVVVHRDGAASGNINVEFTILMEPQGSDAEGWQTGVALDASASMKPWYGQFLEGTLPPEVRDDYQQRGWLTVKTVDGKQSVYFEKQAYTDAMQKGYLRLTANIVQPLAREFLAYLAGNLDADGGTTVIYWACGMGDSLEVIGDVTAQQCATLELKGPKQVKFGKGTMLRPAVQYFADRFADAKRGMYVFITDGRVDDLDEVKRYTADLARRIAAKQQSPVKCVLIGVGDHVDESQMEELDSLDTGTDVDVWDHKIAADMRALVEIFAEVVSENQLVAPSGAVFDSDGNQVKIYNDGLPSKISATMPATARWFELEVAGQRIRQTLVVAGA